MDGLLKFMTCGSVDDGKSTLIGHMLYDAKLLFADQKHALEVESRVGSRAENGSRQVGEALCREKTREPS